MNRSKQKTKKQNLKHHASTYKVSKLPVRVAHHVHTGRKLPFYCTSYAVLFFLIALTSLVVLFVSNSALADTQSSSINLSGVIKGNPPEIAAKITSPKNGAQLNDN